MNRRTAPLLRTAHFLFGQLPLKEGIQAGIRSISRNKLGVNGNRTMLPVKETNEVLWWAGERNKLEFLRPGTPAAQASARKPWESTRNHRGCMEDSVGLLCADAGSPRTGSSTPEDTREIPQ